MGDLDLRVHLAHSEVWSGGDLIPITSHVDSDLREFMRYRRDYLKVHPHHDDTAYLITLVIIIIIIIFSIETA